MASKGALLATGALAVMNIPINVPKGPDRLHIGATAIPAAIISTVR
jgi:hypothetical protein